MSDEHYELPEGWAWMLLDDVCAINPRHPKGVVTDDTPVSFVPMAAVDHQDGTISGSSARPYGQVRKGFTHFREGDVLFARITPCMENGKVAVARGLVNGLGCGTTEFHVLRPLGGILSEYVYRYLRQESFRRAAAANMSGTAGQLRVPTDYMKSVELPLAPLAEQRRIVAKIEALFEQRRTARQALDRIPPLLKKFRQSVLAAAFRGDLTRDWREQHPEVDLASVLLDRIRAERQLPARGKDSHRLRYQDEMIPSETEGLDRLPANWVWSSIGQLFEVSTGGTPSRKKAEYWNGTIPWVSSGEVAFSRIRDTRERITQEGLLNSNAKLHPPGTVLLAMIGEGKTRGQVAILDIAASTNQNVAAILCGGSPIPPEFAFYWLRYRYEETRSVGEGGAQPALNAKKVRELPIPLPPITEQVQIIQQLRALFSEADVIGGAAEMARRVAGKLDQSILARAFRGELVPQDPTDEPPSAILDRIHVQRRRSSTTKRPTVSHREGKTYQDRNSIDYGRTN